MTKKSGWRTPDWGRWAQVSFVELWQAVLLSCGADPTDRFWSKDGGFNEWREVRLGTRRLGRKLIAPKDFNRRILYAAAQLAGRVPESPGAWSKVAATKVALADFAGWAARAEFSLPDGFPRTAVRIGEPSAVGPRAAGRTAGVVVKVGVDTIEVPHMPMRLRELLTIMREEFTGYDPTNSPKQEYIAAKIDERVEGKKRNAEKTSRNAQTFAALIRPDELRQRDLRLPGARAQRDGVMSDRRKNPTR